MVIDAGLDQSVAEKVVRSIWILDIFLRKNLKELLMNKIKGMQERS